MKVGVCMESIGNRIRKRREELNISQDELARRVGYKSRTSIAKIENDGRELPQSKIYAIATALNTTPSYIMGWEDEEVPVYVSEGISNGIIRFINEVHDTNLTDKEVTQIINFANYLTANRNK